MASRRVLLVDDEESLLRLLGAYLTRCGYQVTCCSSALDVRQLDPEQALEAIVMDLGLPDVNGCELVRYLLEVRPGIPILISSGSPFDVNSLGEEHASRVRFLPKPYLPKALSEALE